MFALIRRALRAMRYRRRWGRLAALARSGADRATALHDALHDRQPADRRAPGLPPARRRGRSP
jgi:hypothetical protein